MEMQASGKDKGLVNWEILGGNGGEGFREKKSEWD